MVDEDTGELVADGPLHERRRHRGVDAAREGAEHARLPHLLADRLDELLDDVGRRPVALDARAAPQEVLEHPLAERRVHDLGVPLHAVEPALVVLEGATGAPEVEAVTRMPAGASVTESPWLIQTDCSSGWPLNSTEETSEICAGVEPYSPRPVLATVPPSAWTMAWKP